MFPKSLAKFWNKEEKTDQDAIRSTEGMTEQPEDSDKVIPASEPERTAEPEQATESEQMAESEQPSEPKEVTALDHIRELEQLLGMEPEKQENQVPE